MCTQSGERILKSLKIRKQARGPRTGTRAPRQISNLEYALGADPRRMNLMEIATPSGMTRPANGAVDPLGSGRLVGLNGQVSFTDSYTCHLCGKETNRDTNPRQNYTATLS